MRIFRLKPAALLLALVFWVVQPQIAMSESVVALPVDEAFKDLSFARYRTELLYLIGKRDVEGVIAKTCPDIKLSFGGDYGHASLRQHFTVPEETLADEYKADAQKFRDEFWSDLEQTLRMGGVFSAEGSFWAPYTWLWDVQHEGVWAVDGYHTYFVTGSGVLMRDQPNKDGKILGRLNYDVVQVSEYDWEADYQAVRLADGQTGYVSRQYLRSQIDYRAQFEKGDDGRWLMCAFIAGD